MKAREVHLTKYPEGEPTLDTFELAEVELPEVGDGEVRLETLAFSVDPYMRGRMSGVKTYVDPFALGEAMEGAAVSRVVESKHDDVPEGSLVLSQHGRAAICGMISVYNATEPPSGPRNMSNIVTKCLKLQGFLVGEHWDDFGTFAQEVSPLVFDGTIEAEETVRKGLENAPQAFLDMLRGDKQGKMVVEVGE